MPAALGGGVLVDEWYGVPAHELNGILFKPDSDFYAEFTAERKVSQLETGPWIEGDAAQLPSLADSLPPTITSANTPATPPISSRVVRYMTAPSSLVKSVLATELMRYSRADAGGFLLGVYVATPDVPYGGTFRTEMQFCITPASDGSSCHLRVSWAPCFLQSTMMKSMIENGMRSGLKDTYTAYQAILSKYAAPCTPPGDSSAPALLPSEPLPKQPVLARLFNILGHFSLLLFVISLVVLPVHFVQRAKGLPGVQLLLLDLPDGVLELMCTAVIVLSAERALFRLRNILTSRLLRRGDHGKKAEGEGWLLTVTLVQGEGVGEGGGLGSKSDPYVVFTCNGKTRTSSVKLQTNRPMWNEVLSFDAFEDPPSTLDIEVFDYDGPFSDPTALGQAEIDLVRRSSQELADLWVPLQGGAKAEARRGGKAHGQGQGQGVEPRLQLRVLLTSTSDASAPRILERISKQVGKELLRISDEKNTAFHNLFELPENEPLINDFSCALKKNLLSQGRLFLSPRLLAFHASLFRVRFKFAVLWEDIEEIKENIHSLNRLNPSVTIYVKGGRGGPDTRSAAYGIDPSGRLKIRFQSFARPTIAFRLITALWRHRALPPEQQLERAKEAASAAAAAEEGGADAGAGAAPGDSIVRSPSQGFGPGQGGSPGGAAGGKGGAGGGGASGGGGGGGGRGGGGVVAGDGEAGEEQVAVCTDLYEMIDCISTAVPMTVEQFLAMTEQQQLQRKVADATGQTHLEVSDWVAVDGAPPGAARRQRNIKFKYSRQMSPFGTTVSGVQQATKDATPGMCAWAMLEESITLHQVPFGDYFQVETKRELKARQLVNGKGDGKSDAKSDGKANGKAGGFDEQVSDLKTTVGITWQKQANERTRAKIKANVGEWFKEHNKRVLDMAIREAIAATQG
ncbi:hypothetical protein CLOP_g4456 [Closterium sp. NIES-67]|nr:hypothetical protein CLOP_g4456 [Closterium sp. NIES-67]